MENSELLTSVKREFSYFTKPGKTSIAIENTDQNELTEINDYYSSVNRDALTYDEAVTLILEFSLISDRAFWYYFPRLLYFVLNENAQIDMFRNQILYMNKNCLNQAQLELVKEVITLMDKLIKEEDLWWESNFDS